MSEWLRVSGMSGEGVECGVYHTYIKCTGHWVDMDSTVLNLNVINPIL